MPQAKQPIEWGHSSTHQQTGCLNYSGEKSYPSEGQDSAPPTGPYTKKPTQAPGPTSPTKRQKQEEL